MQARKLLLIFFVVSALAGCRSSEIAEDRLALGNAFRIASGLSESAAMDLLVLPVVVLPVARWQHRVMAGPVYPI